MEAECRGAPSVDHGVVQLNPVRQPALHRPPARLVEGAPDRVDEQRIVGSVQLDIGASQAYQLPDLLAHHLDDVGHEGVQARVGARRLLGRPQVREQRRAGQRDFRLPAGAAAQEGEFLGGEVAALVQRSGHGQVRGPFDRGVAHLGGMPRSPQPGVETDPAEAVAGRGELGLERLAPHLPVVDDRQVQFVLQGDSLPHSAVLRGLELGRGDFTPRVGGTRVAQEWRPQQAPDMFHPGGYGHQASIPPRRRGSTPGRPPDRWRAAGRCRSTGRLDPWLGGLARWRHG